MKLAASVALGVALLICVAVVTGYLLAARLQGGASASGGSIEDGRSPAVHHPEVAGMRIVEAEKIDPPRHAPSFSLTSHRGDAVSLSDLSGKVVLLSFVYTNCSEACPLLTGQYLRLQQELAGAMTRGELALVFITTDPDRDTPENLRVYTEGWGGKWLFLTGELSSLEGVWERYGIYREVRERLREVTVYHSYKTYLIDTRGRLRHRYTGVWQIEDVADDLRALLAERPFGDAAPVRAVDFEFTLYGGQELFGREVVRLSEVLEQGRPVVLNFWAGACPPCRREMPDLQAAYERNKDRFLLLGVDGGPLLGLGTATEAEKLVLETGVTYPTGAVADPQVMRDYGVVGMPITYFIKPDGEIVARRMGLLTREKLDSMVSDLLARSESR